MQNLNKPAKAIKPLRFIKKKCERVYIKNGKRVVEHDYLYYEAVDLANKGQGAEVQRIAMSLI